MAEQSKAKTVTLQSSWKNHVVGYALAILLIPVFGIGLIFLYWIRKRQTRLTYEVSDSQITSRDHKYQRNVDLVSIENVEVSQSWIQKKMGVGDLQLATTAVSMTLHGMQNPRNLKKLLEKAIAAEKNRAQKEKKPEPRKPDYSPGTMDKMDYLTGLWQQGLVSDEDYKKEKKHFE